MCDTPSPLPPCAPTAVTSGRSHGGDFAPSASLFLSVSRALRTAGSLTLSRRTTRTCAAHPSCVIGCVSRRPRRQDAESPALCLRSSPSCELRAGWGGSWAPCGMDGSWAPEPRRVEHGLLQGMEHVLLGRAPWLQPPQLPALPGPQTCFPGGGLPFFLSVFFLTPFPLLLPPPVSVLTFGVCGSIPPPPHAHLGAQAARGWRPPVRGLTMLCAGNTGIKRCSCSLRGWCSWQGTQLVPCGRGDKGDQDLRGTKSQGGYLI